MSDDKEINSFTNEFHVSSTVIVITIDETRREA